MGCVGSKSQRMDITQPGDAYSKSSKKKVSDHVSGLPPLDLRLRQDEKVKAELPPQTPTTPSVPVLEKSSEQMMQQEQRPPVPARTRMGSRNSSEEVQDENSGGEGGNGGGIQRRALDLLDEGRLNEAHSVLTNGLEQMSPEDGMKGVTEGAMAVVLLQQGRLREAKNTLEKMKSGGREVPRELKEDVIDTLDFIAQGKLAEAKSQIRNSVERHI